MQNFIATIPQWALLLGLFGIFLLVITVMWFLLSGNGETSQKRIKNLRSRQEALRKTYLEEQQRNSKFIQKEEENPNAKKNFIRRLFSDDFMKRTTRSIYDIPNEKSEGLVLRLSRSGVRDRNAVYRHYFYRLAWTLMLPIVSSILVFVVFNLSWSFLIKLLTVAVTGLIGYIIPDLLIDHKRDKRQLQIKRAFPDALDMMVVCAESGLSMDAAFRRVAREMNLASPEMADEFGLTSVELNFFSDRRQALENMLSRVPLDQVKSFVATMVQTEKYGTPIGQSLRVLSKEFRQERIMDAETKAAKLPAKMTMPLMLCILPPLIIILLAPAIIKASQAFGESSF